MKEDAQRAFYIGITVSFFLCLVQAEDEFIPAFFRMIMPTVDVFSDIAYLLTTEFYSMSLFIYSVIFFFVSNALFVVLLVKEKYLFRAPWDFIRWSSEEEVGAVESKGLFRSWTQCHRLIYIRQDYATKLPIIFDVPLIPEAEYLALSSLQQWMSYIVGWAMAFTIQFFFLIYVLAFIGLYPVFIGVWFLVGCLLFQTKLFSIANVRNYWLIIWMGYVPTENATRSGIYIFALAVLGEFLLETIPQTILQAINNQKFNHWSTLAQFSTAFSIVMVLDGVYFFGYHWLFSHESFQEIAERMEMFGRDDTLSGNRDFAVVPEEDWAVQVAPITLTSHSQGVSDQTTVRHLQIARQLWFLLRSALLCSEISVELYVNDIDCSAKLLTCTPRQLDAVIAKALTLSEYDGETLSESDWKLWKAILLQCSVIQNNAKVFGIISFGATREFKEYCLRGQRYTANTRNEIVSLVSTFRTRREAFDENSIVFNEYELARFEQVERQLQSQTGQATQSVSEYRQTRVDQRVMEALCDPKVHPQVYDQVRALYDNYLSKQIVYLHPLWNKDKFVNDLKNCLVQLLLVRQERSKAGNQGLKQEDWIAACNIQVSRYQDGPIP